MQQVAQVPSGWLGRAQVRYRVAARLHVCTSADALRVLSTQRVVAFSLPSFLHPDIHLYLFFSFSVIPSFCLPTFVHLIISLHLDGPRYSLLLTLDLRHSMTSRPSTIHHLRPSHSSQISSSLPTRASRCSTPHHFTLPAINLTTPADDYQSSYHYHHVRNGHTKY